MAGITPQTAKLVAQSNLEIGSLWQPESLFKDNGRKLKRVAEPGDPWIAQLFYPAGSYFDSWFVSWGEGETADQAVRDAVQRSTGIQGRTYHLSATIDHLTEAVRGFRNNIGAA